jgi:type I restriction enzyme, S subunit
MKWQKVKVGDFLVRVKDLIPIEKDKNYSLVTIKLYHKGVILRKVENGSNIQADKMSRVKGGQFILSGIDARNGAFGIIPDSLDGAVVTNDFWHFEIDESIVSKEYFLWLTSTPYFDDICNKASDGTTNRIRLQADRFYSQELLIPDIKDQHEVVESLKKQGDKISSLNKEYSFQLIQIENLNQVILQESVQGKLVKQDPKDEPAIELLKRIKAEKEKAGKKEKQFPPIKQEEIPFEIPKSWVWTRIGDIVQHNSGKTLDSGRNTGELREYITTSNLYWGYFLLDELRKMPMNKEDLERCSASKGDLLICEGGEAGRSAVWENENSICIQNHIHRVRPYLGINSYYLFWYMKKIYFSGEINHYRKGMGIKNLSGTALSSIIIPLPPIKEQHRIVAEIEKQLEKTKQLKEHIIANQQATEQLLKALLYQAFEVEEKEEVEE